MNPPPNPAAAQAREAMMQHNTALLQNPPHVQKHFYPMDERVILWHQTCNDCGVTLWVDDPAALFSGA